MVGLVHSPRRYVFLYQRIEITASRPQNAFALQQLPGFHEIGTYLLTQSNTGRQILIGEAIVGSVALGYGAATLPTAAGAGSGVTAANSATMQLDVWSQGYAAVGTDAGWGYGAAAANPINWELAATQAGTALGYGGIAYGTYAIGSAIASGLSGAGGRSSGGSTGGGSSSGGVENINSGVHSNAWSNTVQGLDFFFGCVACNMAGPSILDVVGPGAAGYYTYAAWNHAATTPSKVFGTSALMYPARSSIYRGLMTNAGRAGTWGALGALDVNMIKCVFDEWDYFNP